VPSNVVTKSQKQIEILHDFELTMKVRGEGRREGAERGGEVEKQCGRKG
jgi:hypothetical protein